MSTDSDISKEIVAWKNRVTTMSRNLMEFSEASNTKIVQNTLKSSGYSGLTETTAVKSIRALDALWEQYLIVARVIDEAQELAQKNNIFHDNEPKIRELLQGKSVVAHSEYVPIESRGLLAGTKNETHTTPTEMLEIMEKLFVETRDTITVIATADKQLDAKKVVIKQKVDSLTALAKTLEVETILSLSLEQVFHKIQTDPLACTSEINYFETEIKKQQEQLKVIEIERNEAIDLLKKATALWEELNKTVTLSKTSIEETVQNIFKPGNLIAPISDEKIKCLQAWLETLQKTIHSGKLSAAKVGLKKWIEECAAYLQHEQSNYKINNALLEEREELKGQYKALYAKAEKLKREGLMQDTANLFQQCQQILYTNPCDVFAGRQVIQKIKLALLKKG